MSHNFLQKTEVASKALCKGPESGVHAEEVRKLCVALHVHGRIYVRSKVHVYTLVHGPDFDVKL